MALAERRSTDAPNGPRRNAATSACLSRKRNKLWAVGFAVDPRGGQRQADVFNGI